MNLRIDLLIGILIILTSCKTYKGIYCTLPNYTSTCIKFLNKYELFYNKVTDYGAYGINYGKYQIKKDTLIVQFLKIPEKYKLENNEKYEIINFTSTSGDSTRIEIRCKGVWAANIYCKEIKSDSIIFGSSTYLDREINFELPSDKLPVKLIGEYGKSMVQVPINEVGDYKIEITLNELAGSTSYDNLIWTKSQFLIKKGEKDVIYFEQIENEKWGKFYQK